MTEHQQGPLFDYLGRYLVGLCGVLHPTNKPEQSRSFCASAFIAEIDGAWYCVTAGHVIKDIETALANGDVLAHCSLADYFGMNRRNDHPTPISYESTPKFRIVNRKLGLDIGALQLRPLYVSGLQSNGVLAIPEAHWMEGDASGAKDFVVFGFPLEEQNADPADPVVLTVRDCFIGVTPCALPDDAIETQYPLFVATLNDDEPESMVGFSGGPIFRLRLETSGERQGGLTCWLHAVQAFWRKDSRITFGCPMSVVAQSIRERLPNTGT